MINILTRVRSYLILALVCISLLAALLIFSYMVTKSLGLLKLHGLPFQNKLIEIIYKMYF